MAAAAMGVFLATIDGSIVNVALPTLVDEINTDFATVQWVVLAYLLTLSTLLLIEDVAELARSAGAAALWDGTSDETQATGFSTLDLYSGAVSALVQYGVNMHTDEAWHVQSFVPSCTRTCDSCAGTPHPPLA